MRIESDSMGEVEVPNDVLWGAQTQRSLHHFSISNELIPKEMIFAYAILKKACATINYHDKRLEKTKFELIIQVCNEIIEGKFDDQFPLHVWMTGSGTQFNMNINEVIANRSSQLSGKTLGSKTPVHPNDDVNMAQSSNDTFPTAMHIASALGVVQQLIPSVLELKQAIDKKVVAWKDIVKIGRTHMQDATPLTLGQEFSGYSHMLQEAKEHITASIQHVYSLTIGGTAVGTGINAQPNFDKNVCTEVSKLTGLPFKAGQNKFALQGAHNSLVQLSSSLKTLAVALYKIANDIRLLSCGPRAGLNELIIPSNEPGSSIMPGKVNPTQCEALTMIAAQVMANDFAVTLGGAGGILEMNVYKPLIIYNLMQSIRILTDGCHNFKRFLIEATEPNKEKIKEYVEHSLMLVTALSPVIGYDQSSKIAHYAYEKNLTLREAALELRAVTAEEFDSVVDPAKMVYPHAVE